MKRYTPLLLTTFLLVLAVFTCSAYIAGADRKTDRRPMREITAYTTLPAEHAAIIADEYEKFSHIRVNFVPLSADAIEERLDNEINAHEESAAVLLADSALLRRAAGKGFVVPYVSESNDAVAKNFKNADGFWTGVWYDPIIFCANADYLKTLSRIPDNWTELSELQGARIGITDFMAADASANLLYSMIAQFGDQAAYGIWRGIHPNVVQYAKYLVNPVRQAGMGEADIAIAVESETLRYINNGYPLKIIYPADGTSYMLTGTAVVAGTNDEEQTAAKNFADWLLTDEAQVALQKNGFYFVSTNPSAIAYKTFTGKNIVLFDAGGEFSPQEKHDFLDRWVKYIRFN